MVRVRLKLNLIQKIKSFMNILSKKISFIIPKMDSNVMVIQSGGLQMGEF